MYPAALQEDVSEPLPHPGTSYAKMSIMYTMNIATATDHVTMYRIKTEKTPFEPNSTLHVLIEVTMRVPSNLSQVRFVDGFYT
jgi:hypothetical protein